MIFAIWSFLLILFILLYVCIRTVLQALIRQRKARYRLHYVSSAGIRNQIIDYLAKTNPIFAHLKELLESVEAPISMNSLLLTSGLLFLAGTAVGSFFFQSLKGVLIMTTIGAALPYMMLRMRLVSVRMHTRLEFLPAVEVFYQYYMIVGGKNVKLALKACLEEDRMLYPIKPVFDQLYRNLMTQRDMEESLNVFSLALGHVWADYFIGIIRVALTEGCSVSDSLKELIADMRKAQLFDQAERNRLLEIRIANFTPILFLALFLIINFKVNYANAYYYYLLDPAGRNMLLDALLLIFVSFLMGIYLSLRRM